MTARLGLKVLAMSTVCPGIAVEMEMTARLGLKVRTCYASTEKRDKSKWR